MLIEGLLNAPTCLLAAKGSPLGGPPATPKGPRLSASQMGTGHPGCREAVPNGCSPSSVSNTLCCTETGTGLESGPQTPLCSRGPTPPQGPTTLTSQLRMTRHPYQFCRHEPHTHIQQVSCGCGHGGLTRKRVWLTTDPGPGLAHGGTAHLPDSQDTPRWPWARLKLTITSFSLLQPLATKGDSFSLAFATCI